MTIDVSAEWSVNALVKKNFTIKSIKKSTLLNVAQQYHLGYTQTLAKLQENNIELPDMSSQEILDYIFGIDCLVEITTANGNTLFVAIDVTTNRLKVGDKVSKFKQGWRKTMLAQIGVKHCVVLLWTQNQTYQQMNYQQQMGAATLLMDAVDDLENNNQWVTSIII